MKNLLPKDKNSSRGFTLIELMVVVAIIAVLAVVALGIFTGAQGSSRDARRRQEVGSLAKNIESTKDPSAGTYKYTTTESADDYPRGTSASKAPQDPGTYAYCIQGSTSTAPPADPATNWRSSTCPAGYTEIDSSIQGTAGTTDISDSGIKAWKLCASMERASAFFCVTSLTK
ncbi:type II secretion system protein [Candidatus Daviesbacteria bacterium]|nr:type II secretion system protein [Candidatus Daviesbacteria bacterium]